MRIAVCLSLLMLSACATDDGPWVGLNYSDAACGPRAILSTNGCNSGGKDG